MHSIQLKEIHTEIPLHKNQDFILYWAAYICSAFSFSMYMIGESWYVVSALNKADALGMVLMVTTLPRLLLMLMGGVVADRLRRSLIMFISILTRGLLVLAMVGLLLLDSLNLWALLSVALIFGLLDAFYWPASQSLIPLLVSKEQLTRANSLIQTTQQFSVVVGPILAGWILVYGSYEGLFACCSLILLAGSFILFFIRESPLQQKGDRKPPLAEMKEGFGYIRRSSFLFTALFISAILNFFYTGPLVMGIPIVAKEVLKGTAVDLSILESSYAGGMVLGSLMMLVLNLRKRRGLFILSLFSLSGLLLCLFSQTALLWQGALILLFIGAFNTGMNIPFASLVQEITDPDKMGRVMSFIAFSSLGLMPVSYSLLSALLSIGVPISLILMISGFFIFLFSIFVMTGAKTIRGLD